MDLRTGTEDVCHAGHCAGAHCHLGQLPVQLPVKLEDVVSHHEVKHVDQQVGGHGLCVGVRSFRMGQQMDQWVEAIRDIA